MELEMKYGIGGKNIAENIWTDEYLMTIEEADTREKVFMKAAYFDTKDHVLCKNDITFRIRMEGSRIIATLKWSGKSPSTMGIDVGIPLPALPLGHSGTADKELFCQLFLSHFLLLSE